MAQSQYAYSPAPPAALTLSPFAGTSASAGTGLFSPGAGYARTGLTPAPFELEYEGAGDGSSPPGLMLNGLAGLGDMRLDGYGGI